MKERPILFSGPMVRAILEGRKTQTRRVVKDLIWHEEHDLPCMISDDGLLAFPERFYEGMIKCPHGTVGDRLWVREAWGLWDTLPKDGPERARIFYRSTDSDLHECRHQLWRPSIHMPRWASRITLEITGVRVERLQDISEADAAAEGVPCEPVFDTDRGIDGKAFPRNEFQSLWQSINGPESWSANPWVWVIEFRRVQT